MIGVRARRGYVHEMADGRVLAGLLRKHELFLGLLVVHQAPCSVGRGGVRSILRRGPLPSLSMQRRRCDVLCMSLTFAAHEPEPLHLEALLGTRATVASLVPLGAPVQPKDNRRKTEGTHERGADVELWLHGHRRSASADTRQRGERCREEGHAYEHHVDKGQRQLVGRERFARGMMAA